jgi:hypothetical protein
MTKDFDILDSTKDFDILDSTKDSDILDGLHDIQGLVLSHLWVPL